MRPEAFLELSATHAAIAVNVKGVEEREIGPPVTSAHGVLRPRAIVGEQSMAAAEQQELALVDHAVPVLVEPVEQIGPP
jgi:hypothetical protein